MKVSSSEEIIPSLIKIEKVIEAVPQMNDFISEIGKIVLKDVQSNTDIKVF